MKLFSFQPLNFLWGRVKKRGVWVKFSWKFGYPISKKNKTPNKKPKPTGEPNA